MTRKLIKMSMPKLLVVLLIVSAFVFPFFVFRVGASSGDVAASAISQAEEVVASAYEAVLEAEQAGADVSGLLVRLNEGGEYLAGARMSFRLEDFNETVRFADLSRAVGEDVEKDAYVLKDLARSESVQRIWFTATGSVIGIMLVVSGSFWLWIFLKKRGR